MDTKIICNKCNSELTHVCNADLRQAAIDLYKWRPCCFPSRVKAPPDARDKTIPLLSESYLYPLLGKEDARTLMALVNHVLRSAGLDPDEIHDVACKELVKKHNDIQAELKRREVAFFKK